MNGYIKKDKKPPVIDTRKIDWLKNDDNISISLETVKCKPTHRRGIIPISNPNNTVSTPFSNLSSKTNDYLQNGHLIPEGNRNNSLFNACCDFAGNNIPQHEAEKQLAIVAIRSGLPIHEVEKTIRSAYSQQREPSRKNSTNQDSTTSQNHFWEYAFEFSLHYKWEGRNRNNQRALFVAMVERAKLGADEGGMFRASIRELSAIARLSTTTVQKILKQLKQQNLIIRCNPDQISHANLWKFSENVLQKGKVCKTDTLKKAPQWLSNSVSTLNSLDAVEWGALGRSGYLLFQAMSDLDVSMMPKQLAEFTGLTIHQVRYALRKLRDYELAERLDDGWVVRALSEEELDEWVSLQADVVGKGEARVARYQEERAANAGQIVLEARLKREGRSYYNDLCELAWSREPKCENLDNGRKKEVDTVIEQRLMQEPINCDTALLTNVALLKYRVGDIGRGLQYFSNQAYPLDNHV